MSYIPSCSARPCQASKLSKCRKVLLWRFSRTSFLGMNPPRVKPSNTLFWIHTDCGCLQRCLCHWLRSFFHTLYTASLGSGLLSGWSTATEGSGGACPLSRNNSTTTCNRHVSVSVFAREKRAILKAVMTLSAEDHSDVLVCVVLALSFTLLCCLSCCHIAFDACQVPNCTLQANLATAEHVVLT